MDRYNIGQCVYSESTAGNYGIFLKVMCRNTRHLRDVLNDKIQAINGVQRTETILSLEERLLRKRKSKFPIHMLSTCEDQAVLSETASVFDYGNDWGLSSSMSPLPRSQATSDSDPMEPKEPHDTFLNFYRGCQNGSNNPTQETDGSNHEVDDAENNSGSAPNAKRHAMNRFKGCVRCLIDS